MPVGLMAVLVLAGFFIVFIFGVFCSLDFDDKK